MRNDTTLDTAPDAFWLPMDDPAHTLPKIVVYGPSGVGKTTVVQGIIALLGKQVSVSVSWTTRAPRTGEVDGTHYHFRTRDEYAALKAQKGFVEDADVHGNFYGTPLEPLREANCRGDLAMLFPIDFQGGAQTAARLRNVTQVLLVPPSLAALEARLRGRGTDDEQTISKRLRNGLTEIAHYPQAQAVLVNNESERVAHRLVQLIRGETISSDCDGHDIKRLIAGETLRVAT